MADLTNLTIQDLIDYIALDDFRDNSQFFGKEHGCAGQLMPKYIGSISKMIIISGF